MRCTTGPHQNTSKPLPVASEDDHGCRGSQRLAPAAACGRSGIERSENAVVVQVTLNAGRDVALKRAFYAAVITGLQARVGIKRSDVVISLVEVPPENWSFGDGVAQYAPD